MRSLWKETKGYKRRHSPCSNAKRRRARVNMLQIIMSNSAQTPINCHSEEHSFRSFLRAKGTFSWHSQIAYAPSANLFEQMRTYMWTIVNLCKKCGTSRLHVYASSWTLYMLLTKARANYVQTFQLPRVKVFNDSRTKRNGKLKPSCGSRGKFAQVRPRNFIRAHWWRTSSSSGSTG